MACAYVWPNLAVPSVVIYSMLVSMMDLHRCPPWIWAIVSVSAVWAKGNKGKW